MALSAQEKAQLAAETKKITAELLHNDEGYQGILTADAKRKAVRGSEAKHGAAMADFGSGRALARGIEGFKVKKAIASAAKAEGLMPNGMPIKVAPPVVAPEDGDKADAEDDTATA